MLSNGVTVPAYTTYTERDYDYLINDCKPTVIIISDSFQFKKIKNLIHKYSFIKLVISFDQINDEKIDVYLLGISSIKLDYTKNKHLKCRGSKEEFCGGTQGYIITNTGIDTVIHLYESGNYNLLKNISNNGHIDWLYNSTYFKTYYYHKPLIIQPLEETENKKTTWNNLSDNIHINLF